MHEQSETIDYSIQITDKHYLEQIYMPYIKNGGIFIATDKDYRLNDLIRISIALWDDSGPYTIQAKVVWINPKYTHGGSPQGIGVQFLNEESKILYARIEGYFGSQ